MSDITSGDVETLPVDAVRPARSPRLDGDDPDHIQVLADITTPLPPILVHRPTMRVIDGAHRLAAAKLRGDRTIRARFFDGDEHEAFALGVRANITHGMPLTHADRVAAATEIVTAQPALSDRAVAATAGLSAATVARIRKATGTADQVKRTGRDGRARPVSPSTGRDRVRRLIERSPGASLRQLARQAGVSPSTVRRVRLQLQQPGKEPENATVDTALQWLSQDPSVRHTESGRVALRWFLSRAVRPGEGRRVIDALPPHTAFILAKVARECATAWEEVARRLAARAHHRDTG